MTKKYCPIMVIGFNPPEKEKDTDPRLCHPDCAWYNEVDETCSINIISDNLDMLRAYTEYGAPIDEFQYSDEFERTIP